MGRKARKWGTQSEVAHAFANGEAGPRMAPNGSFFWEWDRADRKRTLYSYGYHFPLAVKVPGQPFILNGDSYSVTTRKHQGVVQSAIRGEEKVTTSFSALGQALGQSVEQELHWGSLTVVDATEEIMAHYGEYNQPSEIPPGATAWYGNSDMKAGEKYIRLIHRPSTAVFKHEGEKTNQPRYLLAGMDERSYFISELPSPALTVEAAFNSLQPREVVTGLEEGLLTSEDIQRQGEWFFFDLKVDPKECRRVYHKCMEREFVLPRPSDSSNPHTATRGCHLMDVGVTEEEVDWLAAVGLDGKSLVVSGQVTHPEHRMARLSTTKNIRLFAAVKNRSVADWSAGGRVD